MDRIHRLENIKIDLNRFFDKRYVKNDYFKNNSLFLSLKDTKMKNFNSAILNNDFICVRSYFKKSNYTIPSFFIRIEDKKIIEKLVLKDFIYKEYSNICEEKRKATLFLLSEYRDQKIDISNFNTNIIDYVYEYDCSVNSLVNEKDIDPYAFKELIKSKFSNTGVKKYLVNKNQRIENEENILRISLNEKKKREFLIRENKRLKEKLKNESIEKTFLISGITQELDSLVSFFNENTKQNNNFKENYKYAFILKISKYISENKMFRIDKSNNHSVFSFESHPLIKEIKNNITANKTFLNKNKKLFKSFLSDYKDEIYSIIALNLREDKKEKSMNYLELEKVKNEIIRRKA